LIISVLDAGNVQAKKYAAEIRDVQDDQKQALVATEPDAVDSDAGVENIPASNAPSPELTYASTTDCTVDAEIPNAPLKKVVWKSVFDPWVIESVHETGVCPVMAYALKFKMIRAQKYEPLSGIGEDDVLADINIPFYNPQIENIMQVYGGDGFIWNNFEQPIMTSDSEVLALTSDAPPMIAWEKPIEKVLRRIAEVTGHEPTLRDDGQWMASCPAHADQKYSLSIANKNGKVLVHCFAGCQAVNILKALSLTWHDLSASTTSSATTTTLKQSGKTSPVSVQSPTPVPTAGQKQSIVAIYPYKDANGKLLFEKLRYGPAKKFVCRRPDGHGDWIYSLKQGWYEQKGARMKKISGAEDSKTPPHAKAIWFDEVPPVLYRLPEISRAKQANTNIIWVEGEKDVENLVKLGYEATTNPFGAGEPWSDVYGQFVQGATIVFIPDSDTAGKKHFDLYAPGLLKCCKELRLLKLPEGKDVSDWLALGHVKSEFDLLITNATVWTSRGPAATMLLNPPAAIKRPLQLIGDYGYATTWIDAEHNGEIQKTIVVLRSDGALYSTLPFPKSQSMVDLDARVDLATELLPGRYWSALGVGRYINGYRPDPLDVFNRVAKLVDWKLDFKHSFASQTEMAKLVSLYVFATYFLDAFTVIGYLWPTGDTGVGKSQLLCVVTELSYLGMMILAGGSYASLRDLADSGATLGFDDCEALDARSADPDKRALMLAGNRKGTFVTLKEPDGDGWKLRHIHTYCPRLFSAIRLPDPVLASRTITIPLVRSANHDKANREALDYESWPVDRRKLLDDLWAIGLTYLPAVRKYNRIVKQRAELHGRQLEPWSAILSVQLACLTK
jgi:hypothetical protein